MSVPVHTPPPITIPPLGADPSSRSKHPLAEIWYQTGSDIIPWKEHGARQEVTSYPPPPPPCVRTKASGNITFSFGW